MLIKKYGVATIGGTQGIQQPSYLQLPMGAQQKGSQSSMSPRNRGWATLHRPMGIGIQPVEIGSSDLIYGVHYIIGRA